MIVDRKKVGVKQSVQSVQSLISSVYCTEPDIFSRARGLEHFCHFFLVGGARLSGTIYKKDLVQQK